MCTAVCPNAIVIKYWCCVQSKLRVCAEVADWTTEDDLHLLQAAHKHGYASWLRRSGEQMLAGLQAAGAGSTVDKLEVRLRPGSICMLSAQGGAI